MSILQQALTRLRKKYAGPVKEGASLAKVYRLDERWEKEAKIDPKKRGMYKDKSESELKAEIKRLKDSGPHKKDSPEYTKMKELLFAVRAKSGWDKKVK